MNGVNYMPCCISVLMPEPLAPSPQPSRRQMPMPSLPGPCAQASGAHALAPAPQGLRAHAPRCKEPGLGILAPKARGQGCQANNSCVCFKKMQALPWISVAVVTIKFQTAQSCAVKSLFEPMKLSNLQMKVGPEVRKRAFCFV